jgi:hypothetical protein
MVTYTWVDLNIAEGALLADLNGVSADLSSARDMAGALKKEMEEEAVAEDEAAYEDSSQTFMEIPNVLVPKVRELIAKHTR